MSIIHDIPAEIDTPADDRRRARYMAALALMERLLASSPVMPARIEAQCYAWSPDEVLVRGNVHKDLAAVEAWRAHFGGELTSEIHDLGRVYWLASTVIDGIQVELWTLLDAPAEDGARDAEPAPLPTRERYTDAELELKDRWIAQHGDPADWCEATRLAYANTLANMRAEGTL